MSQQVGPPPGTAQRQRRAIGWGAGVFLGVGIGGAIAIALDAWLIGLLIAVVITVIVAGVYLLAGYGSAETRAARIVAREQSTDEEDEEDDGTY
jgi:hypothetical protein